MSISSYKDNLDKSGFDNIGSAIIVKLPDSTTAKSAKKLANLLLKQNGHADRVFKKVGKIEGKERIPKFRWIAGKRTSLVLHKENGCSLYVDFKRVFFTPRLSSERLRVSKLITPEETVLDMFCGVGPYAILASKKAETVYAIDINKTAINLLNKNLVLNRVGNLYSFAGDSKKVVGRLNKKFDRIIMNFPLDSKSFLPAALTVANQKCVIHLYVFVNVKDGYETGIKKEIKNITEIISKRGRKISRIDSYRAGEVAPYLIRECFDVYLQG